MSEGEHTIITKIPRERLNQIAGRKLSALGIAVRLGADRETLEGELAFAGQLAAPFGGAPIPRGRFAVEGHDHLRFLDPPLSALPPLLFHDVERSGQLEARLAEQLGQRAAALEDLAARLRALGVEARPDGERLLVRGGVKTPRAADELLGSAQGLRVARVASAGGQPVEAPSRFPRPRLEELDSLAALERWLDVRAAELPGAASPARGNPGEEGRGRLEESPPPRNALTLGMLVAAFGESAVVAPTSPVEVFRELRDGSTRYRFIASRDAGGLFKGRLIGPGGDVWSDRFDLQHFPGAVKVAALALGMPPPTPAPEPSPAASAAPGGAPPGLAPTAPPALAGGVPSHLLPHPGEVWVMNVVIEQMDDHEVRYVGTDIDGRPYGAARVLKRGEFEAVFSNERGGWRLLVQVEQVQDGSVVYRQLDRARRPLGAPRKLAASVLVANFIPEAAAY